MTEESHSRDAHIVTIITAFIRSWVVHGRPRRANLTREAEQGKDPSGSGKPLSGANASPSSGET